MTGHVLVVGGGIAGTTAALALRRAGMPVTVLEARPENHREGAVVRLNPNGMDALRAIGVHQDVIGVSFPLIRSEIIGPDGARVAHRLAADPASERGMPRVLGWPRLARTLETAAVAFGARVRHEARVVDVEHGGSGVRAVLDTGEVITGDVLIGADGARSLVRTAIDAAAGEPEHIGTRTVYGFTPRPSVEPPPPEVLRAWVGGTIPFFAATRDSFSGGCYWFTSLPASEPLAKGEGSDKERWRQTLTKLVADEEVSPAAALVAGADRLIAFDDYALSSLPTWHTKSVIVIGDAAHVAPPASEQGAAIGIEDAVELARCLRDSPTPETAFATFEKLRRDRVEAVVALGQHGTRNAHDKKFKPERASDPELATPSPVGGPAWAFDYHIDWDARCNPEVIANIESG